MQRPAILVSRPGSTPSLAGLAERLLQQAGATDTLPTPVEELILAANVVTPEDPQPILERFLARIPSAVHESFLAAWQKVRGVADLRERAIYIPAETNNGRRRFVQAHELGHQVIPWHRVNAAYRDDDQSLSLSAEAQELFDLEANFFAAEIIFQGRRFTRRVRDFRPSFDAVFKLADDHGASRHATLWRFVEEQDERLALLTYWPSRYTMDEEGNPVLRRGTGVGSPRFVERYQSLDVPAILAADHPWVVARDTGGPCDGDMLLTCDTAQVRFQWQAWWNTYSLFVLLRRKPLLSVVGRVVHPDQENPAER